MTNPSIPSQDSVEWFVENLPSTHLNFPDHYIYQTLLEVEGLEDLKETRGRFKRLLTERRVQEDIPLPSAPNEELQQFLNPTDVELKLTRSKELLALASKYLSEGKDLVEAQRLATEQLFYVEAPLHKSKMDEAYFNNRELVEADLRKYLEEGKGDSLISLSTSKPSSRTSIITSNGEKVTWGTYLNRASAVFLGTSPSKKYKNPHRNSDALKHLLKICNVHCMDKEYFNNIHFVKQDLKAFLEYAKGDSLISLSTCNPSRATSVITSNGEEVAWQAYLKRASTYLFGTARGTHSLSNVLNYFLKISGVHFMDVKYFNNSNFVERDLKAFLEYAKGDSLISLSTCNPSCLTSVLLSNGKKITWATYLNRASGILLGTESNSKNNFHRKTDALKELKRICGIEVIEYDEMDEEYFRNREFILADFNAFLAKSKENDLSVLRRKDVKREEVIIASNGEKIIWETYLKRASRILLKTKDNVTGIKNDNPHSQINALKELKKIIGVAIFPEKGEEFVEKIINIFYEKGIVNRESILSRGMISWFSSKEADFHPYGKGFAFLGLILGRTIGGITTTILEEVADKLGWE